MSVIKTDLLQNRLGTSHPAVTKADFVKAWSLITNVPVTPAIRASFNIASLTDSGPGNCQQNFTSLMQSANFAILATSWITNSGLVAANGIPTGATAYTTYTPNKSTGTPIDDDYVSGAAMGVMA